VTMDGDTAVAGRIASLNNGTSDFGMVYDAIDRFASASTRSIDLDTKYQLTDNWALHFKVGYTDAEGNTDSQPFVEFGAPAVFDYDLRGRTPSVQFLNVDPNDPTDAQFIFSSLNQILNNDDETYGYVDAERKLDFGPLKSVKFGAKYADHTRELIFNATTYGGFHVPINTTPATAFAGGPTPSDFLHSINRNGTLTSYWQVDKAAVERILFENLENGPGRVFYPQQNFSVTEKAAAGYAMANFAGNRWRGNVGVRFVRTEQISEGALINPSGGSVQNPFGNFDPVRAERTYNDTLPSLNVVYDLADNTLLRFAVAKVMARPDYTDVAPRISLNPGSLSGSAGNPDLDPYRANQADLSVEYYPSSGTAYALGVYYKDIKSFITDSLVTQDFPVESQTAPSLACTVLVAPNLFNCPFAINQRSNGGGGSIKGVELSITQPLFGGFGVQTNYTWADAEADNGDPLPQSSKTQVNVSSYFENQWVSARLSYTYRSRFFVTFDRLTPLNEKSLASLDASLSVNVVPDGNVALTLDAVNLTNEKIEQYAGDYSRPRAIYDNGRVYFAGVRVKF
jgi:iron complex outermembrane recepter protein